MIVLKKPKSQQSFLATFGREFVAKNFQKLPNLVTLFSAMVTCETYMTMYRELVATHNDSGPFNRSYSNVQMFKLHQVSCKLDRMESEIGFFLKENYSTFANT